VGDIEGSGPESRLTKPCFCVTSALPLPRGPALHRYLRKRASLPPQYLRSNRLSITSAHDDGASVRWRRRCPFLQERKCPVSSGRVEEGRALSLLPGAWFSTGYPTREGSVGRSIKSLAELCQAPYMLESKSGRSRIQCFISGAIELRGLLVLLSPNAQGSL